MVSESEIINPYFEEMGKKASALLGSAYDQERFFEIMDSYSSDGSGLEYSLQQLAKDLAAASDDSKRDQIRNKWMSDHE